MSALTAYITVPDREEALRIGKALVEDRLAACVNVIGGVQSIYWWEGKVEEASECALLAKTDSSCADALLSRVKELHSYAVPCVAFWPLSGGNPDFLAWIARETGHA